MVVPSDESLKQEIAFYFHGKSTAGHPGRDQIIQAVTGIFWWPGMNDWLAKYVKGCVVCQQNKNLTHKKKTLLYHIPAHPLALPFQVIAMDLITQLPKSNGYDAILTIID